MINFNIILIGILPIQWRSRRSSIK